MKQYELMLILSPSISEEDRENSIKDLQNLLKENGATIKKEDIWGEKKLAYKINKSENGFYIIYDLEINGSIIKEVSKTINLDTNIWRYMFVKQED